MSRERFISTFMTHDMDSELIRGIATGRDDELEKILSGIKRSTGQGVNRQHFVIYGERGAGKSFMMRLAQIHLQDWIASDNVDAAFVLLPEKQVGIRTAAQLLRAIRFRLEQQQFAYFADKRPRNVAFQVEAQALQEAIDKRFGPDKGLLIAAVENYDVLSQRIFGSEFGGKTKQAAEQRQDEERFRKLLNEPNSRIVLLAAATKTVDMDYDRPLFKAFESVDLSRWTPEICVEYFRKRRQWSGQLPLDEGQMPVRWRSVTSSAETRDLRSFWEMSSIPTMCLR